MMTQKKKQIQKTNLPQQENRSNSDLVIPLGNSSQLDLSALPESTRNAMLERFTEGTIDNVNLGQKLAVENKGMYEKMGNITDTVSTASQAGASITMSSTIEDSMGRTEVIVGNTDTAARGKLTRSQRGETDSTMTFVVIGAVVIILIALFAAMGS